MPFFAKRHPKTAKKPDDGPVQDACSKFYVDEKGQIIQTGEDDGELQDEKSQHDKELKEVAERNAFTQMQRRSTEERRKLLDYQFRDKLGFDGKDMSEIQRGFCVKICLFGLPGAGKSSFIYTVETCFKNVSKERKTMFLEDHDTVEVCECLSGMCAFKLYDTKGFGASLCDNELEIFDNILKGKMAAARTTSERSREACAESPLSECIHALLFVVNHTDSSLRNKKLKRYLRPFKDTLKSMGITPVTVVTCMDEITDSTHKSEITGQVMEATGSSRDNIFFVSNYRPSHMDRNPQTELGVFGVLNRVLICAEQYVKSRLKSRAGRFSRPSYGARTGDVDGTIARTRMSFSGMGDVTKPGYDRSQKYSNIVAVQGAVGCESTSSPRTKEENDLMYRTRKPLPPTPEEVHGVREQRCLSGSSTSRQATTEKSSRKTTDDNRTVVVALEDFASHQKGDLSLKSGMEYIVLDDSGTHFWKGRDPYGNTGFFNRDLVMERMEYYSTQLAKYPWFYKEIGQGAVEMRLEEETEDGTFLVRPSSNHGNFTLSLMTVTRDNRRLVYHYPITKTARNKYHIIKGHDFADIPQLVEYHQLNGGGLVTRLRKTSIDFQDAMELDPRAITMMQELGSGQFSVVRMGKLPDGQLAAIKMMKRESWSVSKFMEEVSVMRELRHSNLVRLYGVCTRKPPFSLVMEYMSQGCLLDFLKSKTHLLNEPATLLHMAIQVCSAMAYLESRNFIHRDLAARNCLVGDNITVKVADFGLTRYVMDDEYIPSWGTKFPVRWASPEVLLQNKYSSKSDVWSFGIFLWEMYTGGEHPYESMTNTQYIHEVTEKGYRLKRPVFCQTLVYNVMLYCWKANPDDRPTFHTLCEVLQDYHKRYFEPRVSQDLEVEV